MRVTDVLLPRLRELVAEVIAARRLVNQNDSSSTFVPERARTADLLGVCVRY